MTIREASTSFETNFQGSLSAPAKFHPNYNQQGLVKIPSVISRVLISSIVALGFLVQVVLAPTGSFSFTVTDRGFWQGEENFCKLANWHSSPTNVVLIHLHMSLNYKTLPVTGPAVASYLGGKWIVEDIGTDRSTATMTTNIGSDRMPTILAIQMLNSTDCKLIKMLRWNVATQAAAVTDIDMVAGIMNKHKPLPAVTWDGTQWVVPGLLRLDSGGTTGNPEAVIALELNQAPTDTEWDDPRLYRMLMNGIIPEFWDDWWFSLDAFYRGRNYNVTYKGQPIS